jgi:hypothetical protein
MALQPFIGPWPLLQFRNLFYTDCRTHWTSDQPVARPLPNTNRINWQTPMPSVALEPRIPMFDRAKTAHALHRAVTVMGQLKGWCTKNQFLCSGVLKTYNSVKIPESIIFILIFSCKMCMIKYHHNHHLHRLGLAWSVPSPRSVFWHICLKQEMWSQRNGRC